ncbi:nitric oxide synthase oxygenase [Microcoleus sp. A003_D6]|uniref:nitric oxide synthase oxygenase n=1 Tax=Microcoleus sp. A003_D6 TaxID=3055266 RepID=UPI002FD0B27C
MQEVYSFKKHNVRMLDHHAMGDYFMKFFEGEKKLGRPLYADWGWIIPPVSGSTSGAGPIELDNRILKPNYLYQPEPWKTESEPQGCPFHQQSTIPTTQRCPVDRSNK